MRLAEHILVEEHLKPFLLKQCPAGQRWVLGHVKQIHYIKQFQHIEHIKHFQIWTSRPKMGPWAMGPWAMGPWAMGHWAMQWVLGRWVPGRLVQWAY